MKLLDPRSDFLFKRLFADNPRLLMDLLNATLPLENPITEIEYLPAELLPYERNSKLSIVDVRCSDMFGRHFIVEMQMAFQPFLHKRMMYNAAKSTIKNTRSAKCTGWNGFSSNWASGRKILTLISGKNNLFG